ncbi:MAG: DUF3576 domain-containing protein [Alphaproteobacteria bacterium]|nr:DUF3576 domain-containing protein [Alphaproteobacteria bacterium]
MFHRRFGDKIHLPRALPPNRYTMDDRPRPSALNNFRRDDSDSGFSWTWAGGNNRARGQESMWSAALGAVSFMPLSSADSAGGVIITDWYAPPQTPDQRFRLNVIIRGDDDVSVTAFKQERKGGQWGDSAVDPALAEGIRQAIIRRSKGEGQ